MVECMPKNVVFYSLHFIQIKLLKYISKKFLYYNIYFIQNNLVNFVRMHLLYFVFACIRLD